MKLEEYVKSIANFYYIQLIDPELYKKLQKADTFSVSDIKNSATVLREALAWFIDRVFKENNIYLSKDKLDSNLFGYEQSLKQHPIYTLDAEKFSLIRRTCNAIIHSGEKKYEHEKKLVNHQSLLKSLSDFDEMLWTYYSATRPEKCNDVLYPQHYYDWYTSPVNGWYVKEVLPRSTMLGFDREIIGCQVHSSGTEYALIRQYPASAYFINNTNDSFASRETDTGKEISVFAKHPNTLSVPAVIYTYDMDAEPISQRKRLILYPLGTLEPHSLSDKNQISNLTLKEKLLIMYDLSRAIRFLHKNNMSHRGLTPNTVFFLKGNLENDLHAIVTSLEHCKLPNAETTVKELMKQNRKIFKNERYYSVSMLEKIQSGEDEEVTAEEWKKEDIYSLGAIFWYLLSEKTPAKQIDWSECRYQADDELISVFSAMTDKDPSCRPDINKICSLLKQYDDRDD